MDCIYWVPILPLVQNILSMYGHLGIRIDLLMLSFCWFWLNVKCFITQWLLVYCIYLSLFLNRSSICRPEEIPPLWKWLPLSTASTHALHATWASYDVHGNGKPHGHETGWFHYSRQQTTNRTWLVFAGVSISRWITDSALWLYDRVKVCREPQKDQTS